MSFRTRKTPHVLVMKTSFALLHLWVSCSYDPQTLIEKRMLKTFFNQIQVTKQVPCCHFNQQENSCSQCWGTPGNDIFRDRNFPFKKMWSFLILFMSHRGIGRNCKRSWWRKYFCVVGLVSKTSPLKHENSSVATEAEILF